MVQVRAVTVQEVHLFQQPFPFGFLHVGHLPVKGVQHARDRCGTLMFTNGLSLAFQLFLLLQIGRFFPPGPDE